jgi:hypothetical protein
MSIHESTEGVPVPGSDLINALESWVAAGLITDDQAQAIQEHESRARERELPGWVEPVAYLGAALIAVALFLFGVQVWNQLATWGQVALSALITLVLIVTGMTLRRFDSAPAYRAASFAWFLAVAGVAATSALIFSDVLELDFDWASLLTAVVSLVSGVGLYLVARTTLQQVAIAGATAFLLATLPGVLPLGEEAWMFGLVFLAVGVMWLLFTWAGYFTPQATGWVLGSLFTIAVGFGSVDDNAIWSSIGIAMGLALVWLSTRLDRRALLGLGVLALVIWIPTTVIILFEESIAVPVAILITGVVTLTVVVAAVRLGQRRTSEESKPTTSGGV